MVHRLAIARDLSGQAIALVQRARQLRGAAPDDGLDPYRVEHAEREQHEHTADDEPVATCQ